MMAYPLSTPGLIIIERYKGLDWPDSKFNISLVHINGDHDAGAQELCHVI